MIKRPNGDRLKPIQITGHFKMEILTSNRKKVPTKTRWQDELKSAFRDVDSLLKFVGLTKKDLPELREIKPNFPVLVPRAFAQRIRHGDRNDPLLAQVLAWGSVSRTDAGKNGWKDDPVCDSSFEKVPGLLHKYQGRVLMLLTGACAIHCRYCFRQNFDYSTTRTGLDAAINYIREDSTITEVIFSGGDPLLKTDRFLMDLFNELAEIKHLRRIRIHTRTPVVIPSRVTEDLLEMCSSNRDFSQAPVVSIVLHINHHQEIDEEVVLMVKRLRRQGILVFNQAVLLQGVNADFPSQRRLWESLVNLGVVPYYLHCLDRVNGAENYLASEEVGKSLIRQLEKVLPGYGIPRLARETAGNPSKDIVR